MIVFLLQHLNRAHMLPPLLWGLVFAYPIAGCVRLLTWIFHVQPASTLREIAFWIVVPVCVILLVALGITSLGLVTGQYARQPTLTGEIEHVSVSDIPEMKHTTILLIVSIRNLGTSSIAEGWSLAVTPPGGASFSPVLAPLPETMTVSSDTGPPRVFRGRSALYRKVETTPLPPGGMRRGILLFLPKPGDLDALRRPGTTLTLTYRDVSGHPYTTAVVWSGKREDPGYIPGLTEE